MLPERSCSKQFAKTVGGEARGANDATDGVGVDRIVAGNGQNSLAISHDDVFALADDAKAGFFQSTHCM